MQRNRRSVRARAGALASILAGATALSCAKSDEAWLTDLSSRDPFVRGLAAIAIAEQAPEKGRDAIQVLLEVVDGRASPLRPHASRALAALTPHCTADVTRCLFETLFVSEENRTTLQGALVALGPRAVPALAGELDGADSERTRAVSAFLIPMGHAAVEPLAEVLTSDPRVPVRRGVAWVLGHMGRTANAALPALALAVTDPDPELARIAAESLQRVNPQGWKSLDPLRKALAHPDAGVRRVASESVGRILAVRAVTPKAGERRALLAEALALGDAAVPGAVEATLNDHPERARFGTDVLLGCASRWAVVRSNPPLDADRVAELDRRVRSGPGRGVAALELGRSGAPARSAMPALVAALSSEVEGVRTCAGLGLALIAIDIARTELARPARPAHADRPDRASGR